jgi:hypothetical protein
VRGALSRSGTQRSCKCSPRGLTTGHANSACCRRESRNSTYLPKTDIASVESGSEPVFVQQPAETVNSLDSAATFQLRHRQVGDRRFEVDAAVRALMVVVGHEFPQYALCWRSLRTSTQSRHSARAVSTNLSANAFALGARKGVLMTWAPTDLITSSKGPRNLLSRSRTR